MANRDLVVRFIGDERDLTRAMRVSERNASQFQSRFTKLNQSLRGGIFGSGVGARGALLFGSGAFIGSAAIGAGLRKSVDQAVSLNEELSKSEQIFGEASGAVESWSQTTARSIGIAQAQALQATGTFGNLFRVVEIAPQQAAEMSQALVKLAADLASFNNADPSDVLVALRSGLIGEAEPLRRYGVLLSEARVQQLALAQTGKQNVRALTDQEKALARYQIILRDTAPAQGDFERTSDSLANQSRILRANLNDLAGNIGRVLIPVLTDAADAANLLFIALDKFRGVDFSPGFEFPEIPDELRGLALAPLSPAGAVAVTVKKFLADEKNAADEIKKAAGPGRGIGEHIAQLEEERAKELERGEREADRAKQRQRRAFAGLTKGLGLKLSKAELTAPLNDDIAVLREMERAILRQIEREGKTFELVERLTNVRLQIAAAMEAQAQEDIQRTRDAWNATLDSLALRLDIASTTKSLQDDLRVLREIERVILKRITAEGRSTELLRELFDARQRQAEIQQQMAENARQRRQEDQFKELGLTATGEERVPGADSLTRRARSLQDRIKGTVLDTAKTQAQLANIVRVLSGKFGKAGRDVRAAILRMLNDITSALESGGSRDPGAEITPGGIRPLQRLVEGLGLTEEQIAEMERRMRRRRHGRPVNAFGVDFDGPGSAAGRSDGATKGAVPPQHIHIYIDGKEVTNTVVRGIQKTGKRRAARRSGAGAGRGAVL